MQSSTRLFTKSFALGKIQQCPFLSLRPMSHAAFVSRQSSIYHHPLTRRHLIPRTASAHLCRFSSTIKVDKIIDKYEPRIYGSIYLLYTSGIINALVRDMNEIPMVAFGTPIAAGFGYIISSSIVLAVTNGPFGRAGFVGGCFGSVFWLMMCFINTGDKIAMLPY